jgi:multisubunit Na+/H+ antiporter MnhC subunit
MVYCLWLYGDLIVALLFFIAKYLWFVCNLIKIILSLNTLHSISNVKYITHHPIFEHAYLLGEAHSKYLHKYVKYWISYSAWTLYTIHNTITNEP